MLLVSRSDAPRLVDWAISPSVKWLAECLLPKIVRWTNEDEGKSKRVLPNSLVGEDRYSQLYTELKRKYGRKMAEVKNLKRPLQIAQRFVFYIDLARRDCDRSSEIRIRGHSHSDVSLGERTDENVRRLTSCLFWRAAALAR